MQKTPNLELNKPENNEFVNVTDLNDNADIIDEAVTAKVNTSGGDISETTIATLDTNGTEFPVPAAGERAKTFLGKVRKFIQDFNDFKSGIITLGKLVNNGQTTMSGYALDARYGKTLYDLLASHKSSGDHDSRYYTENEINAKFNSLVKVATTTYTGDGSGRRTVSVSNFTVYNLAIKPNNNVNLFGGDGGVNSYIVPTECNQSGVTYYAILFGITT